MCLEEQEALDHLLDGRQLGSTFKFLRCVSALKEKDEEVQVQGIWKLTFNMMVSMKGKELTYFQDKASSIQDFTDEEELH